MMEVAALGAVTVMILSFVIGCFHGTPEKISRPFYLVANPGQIHQSEWSAVVINEILQRNAVESEITILQVKSFLREIVRLFDEIKVRILHFP